MAPQKLLPKILLQFARLAWQVGPSDISLPVDHFSEAVHGHHRRSCEIPKKRTRKALTSGELQSAPSKSAGIQDLILLVHGIRTFANWQPMVKRVLEEIPNTRVIPIKYGYFD